MDTQYCPFQIGSYYATDDLVTCSSAHSYLEERQRSLQYSITIEELPEKYRKFQYRKNHAFDTCGFNLLFSKGLSRNATFGCTYISGHMVKYLAH